MRWMVVVVVVLAAVIAAGRCSLEPSSVARTPADSRSAATAENPAGAQSPARDAADPDESADEATQTKTTRFTVTSEGRPVADARIMILYEDVEGTTDAQGTVELVHSYGAYDVVVRKVGYETGFSLIEEERTIVVTLKPGTPARGQIVSRESRKPVEGARVRIQTIADHPRWLDIVRRTDANGWYTVAGLGDRWPLGLIVSAPGYAPVEVEANGLPLPQVSLGGGARVEGRVTGADGLPLCEALVFVLGDHDFWQVTRQLWEGSDEDVWPVDKMWIPYAETDTDGRYAIRGLEVPRICQMLALGPAGAHARVRGLRLLDADTPLRHDFRVEESASLEVRVSAAAGKLDWSCAVSLDGASDALRGFSESLDESDEADVHIIEGLTPGSYNFTVKANDFLPWSGVLALRPGEARTLEVTLQPGLAIHGIVVDSNGKPVEGIDVYFHAAGLNFRAPGGRASDISGDDGRFEVGGLARVRGTLHTSTRRRSAWLGPKGQVDPFSPLRVENVEPGGEPVRLVLPTAARIVVEFDPCPRFPSVMVDGDRVYSRWWKREGSRLTIGGLPLGKPVEMRFEASEFAPIFYVVSPLKAGETRNIGKLGFQTGVTVSGRVVDESGAGVRRAEVRITGSRTSAQRVTEADGSFRVPHLTPDVSILSVSAPGFLNRTVRLSQSIGLAGLTVTLSKGGLLVGRVLDTQGNPAGGSDWSLLVVRDDGGTGEKGWPAEVNAASEFRLRLEPGAYLLLLRVGENDAVKELSRKRFEIRSGEETQLEVTRR